MPHTHGFRKLLALLRAASPDGGTNRPGGLTRRSFVKGLIGVGAGAMAPLPLTRQAFAAGGRAAPRIAIIGAGMAGLSAAYRLQQAGFDAHIYEASSRLGGRMFSRMGLVGDGLVTDMGAELINTDHPEMLKLARDFHIPLFNKDEDAAKLDIPVECFFLDGRKHDAAELAQALRPLATQIAADAALLDANFKINAPALDHMSVADYLDRHDGKIAAPYIRALVESTIRTEYGVEPGESSALQLIYNLPKTEDDRLTLLGRSDEVFAVVGGSQRIADAVGRKLANRISYKKELRAVTRDGDAFRLHFGNGATAHHDYVICAIPFTVLRDIEIAASLPDTLRQFIGGAGLGRNEKVFAGFKTRIWRDAGTFSLSLWSDGGFSEAWDETQRQSGRRDGALNFFTGGAEAEAAAQAGAKPAGERFIAHLDRAAPGTSQAASGRFAMSGWIANKWTRGAYASFRPGQLTTFGEHFWVDSDRPEERQEAAAGNLLFVGEHLSDAHFGFMEGAAQTGRLAADALMRRLVKG